MYLSGPTSEYRGRPRLPTRQHRGSQRGLCVPQKLPNHGLHLSAIKHTPEGPNSHALLPVGSFPFTQHPACISQVSFVASHPSVTTDNPLVQRSPVGKAKRVYHEQSFPLENHLFEYKAPQLSGGNVRAALQSWMAQHPSAPRKDVQNFPELNRVTLQNGATTPKQVSACRRSHAVTQSRPRNSFRPLSTRPAGNDPFYTYGHRNPPRPGVAPLIQNVYGVEHLQELNRKYQAHQRNRRAEEKQLRRVELTKAAFGHSLARNWRHPKADGAPSPGDNHSVFLHHVGNQNVNTLAAACQFKIKKFGKTPPRTTTRWKRCPTSETEQLGRDPA
ncbi:hypothetical protein TGPRC2_273750 [Toxoplasma gondii TgCatPRC2]|uniref:Uncharacterized protein n=11 Tax=Toxoplasma gondii TaxID=5811 RepID=S7V3G4_TOXGG|nr:hypothetical protein TGGT1_273750 [Toxoplasma gondii GT1]KAF4642018.1 hypothetical protein TGRH88_078300 [Toxoplasma gondii]KFG49099.1 hypothetical protein TGDOM2_273750 [Toxoplasma gondii GAB2-2007-GAL-DOM2]KFG50070.1 hypothetical protein TGFOU_273750 [Toxoplasma gondii FOU]KFG51613.1 hypothetical protein TGP89_273750 [Toxoplasma gondii p89]KFG64013.1 hypothetical protein TGRUB_273750 [Toxoplasma gondii RUB]KFH17088.1 hypothetical protein TGMAS_273750 [Toxoplasma gondii MAS]KYF46435.1 hy